MTNEVRITMELPEGECLRVHISGTELLNSLHAEGRIEESVQAVIERLYRRVVVERQTEARKFHKKNVILEAFLSTYRMEGDFRSFCEKMGFKYEA